MCYLCIFLCDRVYSFIEKLLGYCSECPKINFYGVKNQVVLLFFLGGDYFGWNISVCTRHIENCDTAFYFHKSPKINEFWLEVGYSVVAVL